MVKSIRNLDQWATLMEESKSKLVVVDYTASWCPPCKRIAPHFEKLEEEEPNIIFVKIDVDHASDVVRQVGINCMPTFHCFRDGSSLGKVEGEDLEGLKALVSTHKFDSDKAGEDREEETVDAGETSIKEGEEDTKKRQGEGEGQIDDAKRLKTNDDEEKEGGTDDKPKDSNENGDQSKDTTDPSDGDDKPKDAAATGDDSKSKDD